MQDLMLQYPAPRSGPFDPADVFADLRTNEPVSRARIWDGSEVWLATTFDLAREVLMDSERFSNALGPGYPTASASRFQTVTEEATNFVRMDPPEHTHRRRMITADFTMKAVNALRPRMEAIIDDLFDKMEAKGPPADLVKDFGLPLPTTIITEYLGLGPEDHSFIHEKSSAKFDMSNDGASARKAQVEMLDFLEQRMLEKGRGNPSDDLMYKLLKTLVETSQMSLAEAVSICELTVTAGHETTTSMISLGTLALLQHPDQMEMLRNDRKLMGSAINEMLRYLSVNQNVTGRRVVKDTVLGGQQIKAGEGVFAVVHSANRDASVFPEPDTFDITRNPTNHLAFGYGAHQCLGLTLAKVEMDVAFNKLLDRFPNLKLAVPFEEIENRDEALVFAIKSLPVTW